MSFLANKELQKELPAILGADFDDNNIKNASYELFMGDEIYSNNDSTKTILDNKNSQFELKPGQFALLITKEKLSIPPKFIGFISLKFGFKKKGLVNISGFHVDPGFDGKLKFSVYNAGSKSIILQKDKPYFVLWLSELTSVLSKDEQYGKEDKHQNQSEITPDDIMNINGETASPNVLLKKIEKIELNFSKYWWLLGILLFISLGILTRLYWQKSKYEEGFKDGYSKKQIEEKVTNKVDLIINKKMDSIINAKFHKIKVIQDTVQK